MAGTPGGGRLDEAQRERLYELFDAVTQLPQAERAEFCRRACEDDPELLAELEDLLGTAPAVGELFLATPVLSATPDLSAAGLGSSPGSEVIAPPERIGRYILCERLGEGGMGIVHRAEQTEPVRRDVAIKLIKPGMDSARIIRRFETERQALAMMNHPGIARIHDAGTTPEGRPWFAMELVRGEPIDAWCRNRHASIRSRLELLAQLCDAVQHAHQKGIIHRDLKPSNALVTEADGTPRPVVIDFGIARALTDSHLGRNVFTRHHELVGTLDYMAPEQAEPGTLDVDSRADIYSLGVLLYELLTGRRPFDGLDRGGPSSTSGPRAHTNRSPPAPSSRIECGPATAEGDGTTSSERRSLRRALRGDLDWITLRALAPEPARRYSAASEFAADLRRHLAGEPVLAGPPGAWYRLRKAARRNRVALAALTLIVLTLVVATVTTRMALLEARDQRDAATSLSEELRRSVTGAEAVGDFLFDLLALTNPERGPNVDKRAMLDHASARVANAFPDLPLAEAKARRFIGEAYASLDEHVLAIQHLEVALQLLAGAEAADPTEQYLTLWSLRWPLAAVGQVQRSFEVARRYRHTAWNAFAPDHPEIAAGMHRLWIEARGPATVVDVPTVVAAADAGLAPPDPRWILFADFLQEVLVRELFEANRAGQSFEGDGWIDQIATIYEDRIRLPPSSRKLAHAVMFRAYALQQSAMLTRRQARQAATDGQTDRARELHTRCETELRRAIALADSVSPLLGSVILPGNVLYAMQRSTLGTARFALGEPDRGLSLLDESVSLALGPPRQYGTVEILVAALDATREANRSARAEELRRNLLQTMLSIIGGGPYLDEIVRALPASDELFARKMLDCERVPPGERDELLEELLGDWHRFVPGSAASAVAGYGLLLLLPPPQSPATDVARVVRERVVTAMERCRGTPEAPGSEQFLLPAARRELIDSLLVQGRIDEALATARDACATATGPEQQLFVVDFQIREGRALLRMQRHVEAEAVLRAAYEGLKLHLDLATSRAQNAHDLLQKSLRAAGRHDHASELARHRLDQLLRAHAAPQLLNEVWHVLCDPAVTGEGLDLAERGLEATQILHPEHPRLQAARAALKIRRGDFRAALRILAARESAVRPSGFDATGLHHSLRALALGRLGRQREARLALDEAQRGGSDGGVWNGMLLAEAGRLLGPR